MNRTTGVIAAIVLLLVIIVFYLFFFVTASRRSSTGVVAPTPTKAPEQPPRVNTEIPPVQMEPVKTFRDGTWHQYKTLLFLAPQDWRVVNSSETDVIWMQPASVSDIAAFPRIQISFSRPLEDLEYVSVAERYSGYEEYPSAQNANARVSTAYQAEYPNYSAEPTMIQNRAAVLQEDGNEYTVFYQYESEDPNAESELIFIELLESLRYR